MFQTFGLLPGVPSSWKKIDKIENFSNPTFLNSKFRSCTGFCCICSILFQSLQSFILSQNKHDRRLKNIHYRRWRSHWYIYRLCVDTALSYYFLFPNLKIMFKDWQGSDELLLPLLLFAIHHRSLQTYRLLLYVYE